MARSQVSSICRRAGTPAPAFLAILRVLATWASSAGQDKQPTNLVYFVHFKIVQIYVTRCANWSD